MHLRANPAHQRSHPPDDTVQLELEQRVCPAVEHGAVCSVRPECPVRTGHPVCTAANDDDTTAAATATATNGTTTVTAPSDTTVMDTTTIECRLTHLLPRALRTPADGQ